MAVSNTLVWLFLVALTSASPLAVRVTSRSTVLIGVSFRVDVELDWPVNHTSGVTPCSVVVGDGTPTTCDFSSDSDGKLRSSLALQVTTSQGMGQDVKVTIGDVPEETTNVFAIPGILTLLPPLLAVGLAIATRAVLPSLYCGVVLAATLGGRYNVVVGFLRSLDTYLAGAIANNGHAMVLLFMSFLGALVALIHRSGGAHGLANWLATFATTRTRAELSTYFLGWIIFFDGLTNSLITGSTMQPLTDEMVVSREKLAFIVDATSSPIASLAPMSSWIGFELALISSGINNLKENGEDLSHFSTLDPYVIFLRTIPGRFYPILMLVFVLAVILSQRAFGPMNRAERRAALTGRVAGDWEKDMKAEAQSQTTSGINWQTAGAQPKWYNAVVPMLFTILLIFGSLLISGYYRTLEAIDNGDDVVVDVTTIFGNGDSYGALLWGSVVGVMLCIAMYKLQGLFTVRDSCRIALDGARDMISPLYIIILAWALSDGVRDIGTDAYLVSTLEGQLAAGAVPVIVFIIAALMSFCTGTSWGTMAIVFPLAIPLAFSLGEGDENLFIATVSSILAGAVFGDHCTPISDTTIVSAIACKCALHAHVVTQLPYAVTVALICIVCCELPAGFGMPPWVGTLIGIAAVLIVVFVFGAHVDSSKKDLWTAGVDVVRRLSGRPTSSSVPLSNMQSEDDEIVDPREPLV